MTRLEAAAPLGRGPADVLREALVDAEGLEAACLYGSSVRGDTARTVMWPRFGAREPAPEAETA